MAITVNYYPRMDNIAQTAYGGGQTQEGIRQQNFGLNVEQLAQRERMQNANLNFQAGSQVFGAQVGLEQQRRNIAANQQSQMFDAAQRQQAMAFQAAQNQQAIQQQIRGRFDLAQQDAANRAQMQQAEFQQRQALNQQDYALRQGYTKDMLTWEGQQKMAEFERQRQAIKEWADSKPGVPESVVNEAMRQVDLRELNFDYDPFAAPGPQTFEEEISQRIKMSEDGSGMWIRQPDGKIDFRPVSKAKEGQVYTNALTGLEIPPNTFFEQNGALFFAGQDGVQKLLDPPKPEPQQQAPQIEMPSVDSIFKNLVGLDNYKDGVKDGKLYTPEKALEKAIELVGGNAAMPSQGLGQGPQGVQQNTPQPGPAAQLQRYGPVQPPFYQPPREINGMPFSSDGVFVNKQDVGSLPYSDIESGLYMTFPTVRSKEEAESLPEGTYYNAVMDGFPMKKGLVRGEEYRAN